MRHGQPVIHLESMRNDRKSPAETGQVIADYEFTDLDTNQTPPLKSINIAHECATTFSSDMLRAISSSQMLGLDSEVMTNACFRESSHPYLKWSAPKLKFFTWCILFRLAWFLGFDKNGESISNGRERAEISAKKLHQSALQNHAVLLVGHGIMNRLIVSKLKKMGWKKTQSTGHGYWSYIVMELVR